MPLRSSPAVLVPLANASGTTSYRLTVTIRGKQRKFVSRDLQAVEDQRTVWEMERLHGGNSARPKFTFLTERELREAEAAIELLKGSGTGLLAAVRHTIRNPPTVVADVTIAAAIEAFVAAREGHISSSQLDNLSRRARMLAEFVGRETLVGNVTTEDVTRWLAKKQVDKSTWNGYRGDVHTVFNWFMLKPRKWIAENPVAAVVRYSKRMITREPPKRLEIANCRALMEYLEVNAPQWCAMIALALFAGVRPYLRGGEIHKLAAAVRRDGVGAYFSEGCLHISADIAKDRRARSTTLQPNLLAWLEKYPPTGDSICPGDYEDIRPIRDRFDVGHDILRHTCISAFVAKTGSIAAAATEFGTSEAVIRTHYLKRMSKEESEEFYGIRPKKIADTLEG